MSDCRKCADFDWCMEYEECGMFKPKTMTEADRIRTMTDEELAEWITELTDCAVYPYTRKDAPCISIGQTCAASWIDWLKQEAQCTSE